MSAGTAGFALAPAMAPLPLPLSLRGYQKSWMTGDVIAGVTLAAVAIPECMGYTSIAQTPIVTGLYTIIFPTMVFALLGASRLLVVGADSATAAILSRRPGRRSASPGSTPYSPGVGRADQPDRAGLRRDAHHSRACCGSGSSATSCPRRC